MTQQTEAQRLADEIREDYCRCLPAYKDRGRIDPQCESCNTEDWRHRAAAQLRRLEAVNKQLLEALEKAVKLNSFREFNDHIPAMKAAIAAAKGEV